MSNQPTKLQVELATSLRKLGPSMRQGIAAGLTKNFGDNGKYAIQQLSFIFAACNILGNEPSDDDDILKYINEILGIPITEEGVRMAEAQMTEPSERQKTLAAKLRGMSRENYILFMDAMRQVQLNPALGEMNIAQALAHIASDSAEINKAWDEFDRLRTALIKVRAHVGRLSCASPELLNGLLDSIDRISAEALRVRPVNASAHVASDSADSAKLKATGDLEAREVNRAIQTAWVRDTINVNLDDDKRLKVSSDHLAGFIVRKLTDPPDVGFSMWERLDKLRSDSAKLAEAVRLAGEVAFNATEGFYSGPLPELMTILVASDVQKSVEDHRRISLLNEFMDRRNAPAPAKGEQEVG